MITLLGTAHVFNLRDRVQQEIRRRAPGVVALELDPLRYQALQQPDRPRGGPWAYRYLAGFQEKLAESYGVSAGDEMMAASDAARDLSVPVALIDRDAGAVLRRAWQEMSLTERGRLLGTLVVSAVLPKRNVEKELQELTENYDKVFAELADKFPTLKRVLIDERDVHMAGAIQELQGRHGSVVAVIGDGHVDGITRILGERGVEVDAVRLKELQTAVELDEDNDASASFSVEYSY